MPLADWQFTLDGTFTFGAGTAYDVIVEGLYDRNIQTITVPFEGDGEFLGRRRQTPKQVIFTVNIDAAAGSTLSPLLAAFCNAWDAATDSAVLRWKVPGITNERYLNGTPTRYAFPLGEDHDVGLAVVVAEFYAPMPYVRDAATNAVVRY